MLNPKDIRSSQQPAHTRKPSFSSTMSWLSRSASTSHTSVRPKISGPLTLNAYDTIPSGVLGSGATVVRTPEEALALSALQMPSVPIPEQDSEENDRRELEHRTEHRRHQLYATNDDHETDSERGGDLPSPPHSPAVQPLRPFYVSKSKSASNLHIGRTPPPETAHHPPLPPILHIRDPSVAPPTPPPSDRVPSIPSLPSPAPSPPKFAPILVSPLPHGNFDRSKVIVCLETSTVTYRTKLETIQSRPSRLANYLVFLMSCVREDGDDDPESRNPFQTIFNKHINIQNPNLEPSTTLHIFLDRPSTPYAHLLSYLRTPPGGPPTLPRTVQIRPSHTASAPPDRERIDALLELRDEASYLELDDLHKLCTEEISWLRGSGVTTASNGTNGTNGTNGSTCRPSLTPRPRTASVTSSSSSLPSSSQNAIMEPQRWVPDSPRAPALQTTVPAIVPAPLVVKKTRTPTSPGASYVSRAHPPISPSRSRESLSGGAGLRVGTASPGPAMGKTLGLSMGMLPEEETVPRKLPRIPQGIPISSPAPTSSFGHVKSSPVTPTSAPGWI